MKKINTSNKITFTIEGIEFNIFPDPMVSSKQSSVDSKQSSVEWLISQLKISTYWNNLISELELMECGEIDILEQAKAMHKEEIENAVDGFPIHTRSLNGNDYYNEHYGNN